jgi:hypothetical protein
MLGSFLSRAIAVVGAIAAAAAIAAGLLLVSGAGDDERSRNLGREPRSEYIDELAKSLAENTLRVEPRTCEQIGTPDYHGFEIRVDWDEEIQSENEQLLLSTKYTEELEQACRAGATRQ